MRLSWLAAGIAAMLVFAVAQGLTSPGSDEEILATLAEGSSRSASSAPTQGLPAAGAVFPDEPTSDPGVGRSPGTADAGSLDRSWVEPLTSVDSVIEALGLGFQTTDRPAEPLEAVRAVSDQPFDPAPWAEPPVRTGDKSPPSVSAAAAVVLDEASATVLHGKNERKRLPPASTTKIATLILALEHGRLDEVVESTVDAGDMPGSSLMGLRRGDRFTLREILYGLMLPSGNEAALAVGRHVSGSDEAFMAEIDRLVRRLGLEDTKFIDPHGLGRGGGHYSTAVDMALLARYGMQMPEFREIVGTTEIRVNGSRALDLRNTNQFLTRYAGADGVKTGFTYAGGPTFVGSAVRDGRRLYVVLLNSSDRPGEAAKLLDWAFDNHEWRDSEAVGGGRGRAVGRDAVPSR